MSKMNFPQFRKLSNNKAFYTILDERNFIEYQVIGTKIMKYTFKAEKYPEILRIKEMLSLELEGIMKSSEEEFNQFFRV